MGFGPMFPPKVPGSAGLPPIPPAQASACLQQLVRPASQPAVRNPSATMSTSSVPGAPNLSSVDLMLRYIDLVRKSPWSDYFQMKAIAVVGCRFLLTETDFAEVPPG